jgi:EAL domain-containing protein (putative c-di-GMP-specific phosphodiesterase class I)
MGIALDLAAIRLALATWRTCAPDDQALWLNLSSETLVSRDAHRELLATPHPLVLEITERTPVEDYDELRAALGPLRAHGIQLAIDDVGAGYSSLRHVTELSPDVVKIDRSIISNLSHDTKRLALVASLISFAEVSGITALGEGVETVDEVGELVRLGAGLAQGYHFGHPHVDPVAVIHDTSPTPVSR